jgi:hypothetical protein
MLPAATAPCCDFYDSGINKAGTIEKTARSHAENS